MMRNASGTPFIILTILYILCISGHNTDTEVKPTTAVTVKEHSGLSNGDSTAVNVRTTQEERRFTGGSPLNYSTTDSFTESPVTGNLTGDKMGKPPSSGPDRSIINRGMVSKQTYETTAEVLSYSAVPLLVFAILFNIFNISVFARKDMHTPSQAYLVSLSIIELLFSLLSCVPAIMQLVYGEKSSYTYVYLWYAAYIYNFIVTGLRRSAYVLTLVMTLERFIAIAFPLKFRHFQLMRYPKVLSVAIVLVILLLRIPKGIQRNIVAYGTPGSTETKYRIQNKDFIEFNKTLFDSIFLFNSCVWAYIPLFSCVLLDIGTIVGLKYHSRNQYITNSTTKSASMIRRERQMTTTLLTSSVIFILLSLPLNVHYIIVILVEEYGVFTREHYLYFMMIRIGYICEITSNCTDFVFYIILSSKFRKKFLEIYRPFWCWNDNSNGVEGGFAINSQTTQELSSIAAISCNDSNLNTK